jgi:hypothetical protein
LVLPVIGERGVAGNTFSANFGRFRAKPRSPKAKVSVFRSLHGVVRLKITVLRLKITVLRLTNGDFKSKSADSKSKIVVYQGRIAVSHGKNLGFQLF